MNISISHMVNTATSKDEFRAQVEYIEHKLLERENKKLETKWWKEHAKRIFKYAYKKMCDFDAIVALEVEQ